MMTAVSLSSAAAAADSDPINTPGKQAAPHPPHPPPPPPPPPSPPSPSPPSRVAVKWSRAFYLCIMVGKST